MGIQGCARMPRAARHPWYDPAKMAHPGGGQSSRLDWLERGGGRLTRVSHRGGTPPPGFLAASIWPVVNGLHRTPIGHNFKVKKVFCFKLDAMSVPEALATTIRILLMFSIVLAHRWNPGVWARPAPSETPHRHPGAPPRGPTVHKTRFAARQKSRAANLVLCTFGPG